MTTTAAVTAEAARSGQIVYGPCVIIIRLMINLVDGDRENNRDPELEYLGIFRPTGRKVEDRMTKGGTTG